MDYNRLEDELRQHKPAAPPVELMQKLLAARPVAQRSRREVAWTPPWQSLLVRWLMPASAAVIAAVLVWHWQFSSAPEPYDQSTAELRPAVTADNVEIQQELVSSFDTVARLPSGEPVRFRCSEWMDEVILRDKERGVVIEQRAPRVEVVPVRFETY